MNPNTPNKSQRPSQPDAGSNPQQGNRTSEEKPQSVGRDTGDDARQSNLIEEEEEQEEEDEEESE